MKNFIVFFSFVFSSFSFAQTIIPLGSGTYDSIAQRNFDHIRTIFVDSASNDLYIGGDFIYAGGKRCTGIARWDGSEWHCMGTGLRDPDTVNNYTGSVRSILKYQGEIYICGNFQYLDGKRIPTIAKWNGTTWVGIGDFIQNRPSRYFGVGVEMYIFNSELYLAGFFDSVGTLATRDIAKWNGVSWSDASNGLPFGASTETTGSILEFKGDLFIGGNYNFQPGSIEKLYKFDGNNWMQVGPIITGDATINKLQKFQNQLYVGGYFFTQAGNADNSLVIYDELNNTFLPTQGGVLPSNLQDMYDYQGNLYVVGQLNFAGFQQNGRVAKWNGTNWVNSNLILERDFMTPEPGGIGTGTAFALGEYQGKLVIAGSFDAINGVSANSIALVDFTVGLPTKQNDKNLTIFPNPTSNLLNIQLEKGVQEGSVKLYNQLGQVVYSQTKGVFQTIDVSTFAKGVYFAEVRQEDKVMRQKVVVE